MNAHQVIANFIPLETISSYLTPNISFMIFISSLAILSGAATVILCSKDVEDVEDVEDNEYHENDKNEIRFQSIEHNIGKLSALYTDLEKATKKNSKDIQTIQEYMNESSE